MILQPAHATSTYATSGLHNNVQVIGEGYHPKAGEPHAEVFALRAAGKLQLGKLARHLLNNAALDTQHATSWLASAKNRQLSDASCPDLCLLQGIAQPFAKEQSQRKNCTCRHCL